MLIVHNFYKDEQDSVTTGQDEAKLIGDAQGLVLACSTRWGTINEGIAKWMNPVVKSRAFVYRLPPPIVSSTSLVDDSTLSCPPGEEELYLPRKRRKVDLSSSESRWSIRNLKPWDTSIHLDNPPSSLYDSGFYGEDSDEIWRTHELEEFISSDFTSLLSVNSVENVWNTKDPPRMNTSAVSLYELIPQPHIHKSLTIPHQLRNHKNPSLPPYEKSTPQYLLPYAPPTSLPHHNSSEILLPLPFNDPHARTAWIIPIQASFNGPWAAVTNANLTTMTPNPLPLPQAARNGAIQWTPDALRSFWDFLLQVREAKQVGSIGLSLHMGVPASEDVHLGAIIPRRNGGAEDGAGSFLTELSSVQHTAATRTEEEVWTQAQPRSWFCSPTPSVVDGNGNTFAGGGIAADDSSVAREHEEDPARLLARMDYLKVYHEARYAFVVRNVLHLWGYTTPGDGLPAMDVDPETMGESALADRGGIVKKAVSSKSRVTGGKEGKVRVLKGAKLLLLDSRSRGILIS